MLVIVAWGAAAHRNGVHALAHAWDAAWYQDIAVHGYAHTLISPLPGHHHGKYTNLAFFPVYPLLIKAAHTVLFFLPVGAAALLVAWLSSLAAAAGILSAVAARYGRRTALYTTLLWGAAPYAVVESMAYSEPLFTAFAAWALWALLRRRWLTAGVLAGLAGLTRPTGVAVAAAVIVAAGAHLYLSRRAGARPQSRPLSRPWPWRPVAAAALSPLGWVGFIVWTGAVLHRWDGYFRVQDLWGSKFDFGMETGHALRVMVTTPKELYLTTPVTACILLGSVLLLVIGVIQRQPLPFLAYSAVLLLISLGDAAHFASRDRFLLPGFPLMIPMAVALAKVRSRGSRAAVLAASAGASALYGGYLVFVSLTAP
ncbi:mannosyltransferase family protein [Phaeacidiphilus oryzae]|uniref:mannosyltransferase family protein n=1 Tax=Phaeacidiphilus oryzae TaxID=348818 RepID=UPI001376B5A8|nr:mannosyltransferase family protein [Phaeacidiphilus oryzae]